MHIVGIAIRVVVLHDHVVAGSELVDVTLDLIRRKLSLRRSATPQRHSDASVDAECQHILVVPSVFNVGAVRDSSCWLPMRYGAPPPNFGAAPAVTAVAFLAGGGRPDAEPAGYLARSGLYDDNEIAAAFNSIRGRACRCVCSTWSARVTAVHRRAGAGTAEMSTRSDVSGSTRVGGDRVRRLLPAGETGVRFGEATALRVMDVDLEACRIRVALSATPARGAGTVLTDANSHTPVPVPVHMA